MSRSTGYPPGGGCQKAVARPIRPQGADSGLRVRAHHRGLHARLEDTCALARAGGFAGQAHDDADTVGQDHGRIATRRGGTTGEPALLAHADPDREWCDRASLVWVASARRGGDRVTTDVRSFLARLPPKARLQLQAVRGHGRIENAHHWGMAVAFGEDGSRSRTGSAAHHRAIPGASPTSGGRRPGTRTACANGFQAPTRLDAIAWEDWVAFPAGPTLVVYSGV